MTGAFEEMVAAELRKAEEAIVDGIILSDFRVSEARRAEMVADIMGLIDDGWTMREAFFQITMLGKPGAPMKPKTGLASFLNGASFVWGDNSGFTVEGGGGAGGKVTG